MGERSSPDGNPERILVSNADRLQDVELKHDRVRELLEAQNADAILLTDPAAIAWFSAGADLSRNEMGSVQSSIFITSEARLFATNNVDSAQLFERDAFSLGFQLKQREWFQPHRELLTDLCRGRKVLCDAPMAPAAGLIRRMRLPLTPLEQKRLRLLSKVAVHAIESTAANLRTGRTEAEVAGEIAHRLIKRTVCPAFIQVCADGRNERYRHWTFGSDSIRESAVLSCVARRWGLHIGVSRTVSLGEPSHELRTAHQQASLLHATAMFFSRKGEAINEIWPRVHRIYEKFGMQNEWQLSDQGSVIGYEPCEILITPDNDTRPAVPYAIHWHPSVGIARTGDSVLVTDSAVERLTSSRTWPTLTVSVKGHPVPCPDILVVGRKERQPSQSESASNLEMTAIQRSESQLDEDDQLHDTIWELDIASEVPVFEDDASEWSEESIFD